MPDSTAQRTSPVLAIAAAAMLLLFTAPVLAGVARAPADYWTGWVHYYYDVRHGSYWERAIGDPKWKDSGVYGGYRGALRFDLSALPDSQVTAVRLSYQALTGHISTPSVLTFCGTRFEQLPVEAMWGDIGRGAVVGHDTFTYGWANRLLNAAGTALVDSMIAEGWFQLGVVSGGPNECLAYGSSAPESVRPFLKVLYGSAAYSDLSILSAEIADWPLAVGECETVRVRVANSGNLSCRSSLLRTSYRVDGQVFVDTLTIGLIAVGETSVVDVEWFPSTTGMLYFTACIADTLEWNTANDTLRHSAWTWVYPAGTYAAEDFDRSVQFPPAGWARVNADSGAYAWVAGAAGGAGHTPVRYAFCRNEASPRASDDWLITGEIHPWAGWADTVGLFYCGNSVGRAESLVVYALSSQRIADTLGRPCEATTFPNLLWNERRVSLDAYDGQQVYVGVRYWADGGAGAMLDDFWFLRLREYGVEERLFEAPTGRLELSPNPTRGRVSVTGRELGRWRLLDVAGRVVAEGRGAGGDIDLTRQRPGVYCLEAAASSGVSRTKLVRAE